MRRVRIITINGRSGLDVRVRIEIEPREGLLQTEQDSVVEAITDHFHTAALCDIPYHTIHVSDVHIR